MQYFRLRKLAYFSEFVRQSLEHRNADLYIHLKIILYQAEYSNLNQQLAQQVKVKEERCKQNCWSLQMWSQAHGLEWNL